MKSLRELLGEIGRPHTRRKTLDLERLENRLLLDFTIPPAFDGDIDLNTGTDTGPDGVIRIFGDDADDESGYSVSPAGDVNGDGYEDLLIGAPYADPAGGVEAGETYLVFGRGVSGPYVTTPTDLGSYVGPVSSVEVTFNEAIDESTFTLVDTAIQLSGGGSSQATSIDSLGGNSYRLNFAPRSAAGDYYVVVGPNVEDLAGNEMNQNGNGINGESDDEYWGQFTIGYVDTIHGPNGQQVMIFDLVGPVDINAEDVVVKFGDGNTVKSIKLTGYDSMEGLGVVVSGATYVGGVFDARTGTPRPLAFIACDSPIGTVNLRGGIAGYDLNGLTLAGLALPDDIDGDGETDDPTGIYSGGYLRSVLARGDVAGDVVVGGDLNFLQVIGGDLTGDVVLTGSKIGKVIVKNGDITGDIEADGDIGTVMAIGGDIMGSIVSDSGRISRVLAKGVRTGWSWRGGSIGDGSPDGIISAADYVGSVQALKGDGISTSISAGTWIGLVKSLGGDIDLTEGRSIEAGGTIKNILAIDGDIVGDGGDVHIANGNLGRLRAIRGAIDSVYADVDG
ncbi:MAG: FG-GAP repeat protein, partial [Phycisphaerae bacterium]|nr:FG-GAP repeat protein [Phycisphaerae bacterium]